MNDRVVCLPCLPVARPHLREACRALIGQGHPRDLLTDENVARVLWLARALPVVVDLVGGLGLADTRLPRATVEVLRPPPDRGSLRMLGWRRSGEAFVELLVLTPDAVDRGAVGDAFVRIVVDVEVDAPTSEVPPDDDEPTLESVRLQRFSFG
jgi:hypothetical protein